MFVPEGVMGTLVAAEEDRGKDKEGRRVV